MKDKIIVLSVNPYSIDSDDGKSRNEGLSIMYIMGNNLNPQKSSETAFLGHRVLKGSVLKDNLVECKEIPAIMDCDFEIKPNANGQATLKPTTLHFISPLMKVEK